MLDEASELSEDPLQSLLISLQLFAQSQGGSIKEHDIYQEISLHRH